MMQPFLATWRLAMQGKIVIEGNDELGTPVNLTVPHRLIQKRRELSCCYALQRKPRENYTLKKAKSTFPASEEQTPGVWRLIDTVRQGAALVMTLFCANVELNNVVIRWMSVF
jgi:hypothetical protein